MIQLVAKKKVSSYSLSFSFCKILSNAYVLANHRPDEHFFDALCLYYMLGYACNVLFITELHGYIQLSN